MHVLLTGQLEKMDIVEWLKSQDTGYQSKMNSILLRQRMLTKQNQK